MISFKISIFKLKISLGSELLADKKLRGDTYLETPDVHRVA